MVMSVPVASSSRVALTAPSTEFSIGTIARSAAPSRTASTVACTVGHAMAPPRAAGSNAARAASVNVPSGPR